MQAILHGGAGGVPDEPEPRQAVLDEAADTAVSADDPLDGAVAAMAVLEDDPQFNAGVGGAVQSDGVVRTDAGLMRGSDRAAGAACSMPGVARAAAVARVVLTETPHVLVSGVHAVDLAADFGVETEAALLTDDRRESYEDADPPGKGAREQLEWAKEQFVGSDTVGAVVRDGDEVVAATSTGGRTFALRGRVGDVPQIGSGFYASDAGGASATGAGEDIARVTLSRRAVQHLADGADAQAAADAALEEFADVTGSGAGLVVQGADGTTGSAFNTDGMQTAVAER